MIQFGLEFCFASSLQDEESASVWGEYTGCLQRHWTCPQCGLSLVVTTADRLQHETQCQKEHLHSEGGSQSLCLITLNGNCLHCSTRSYMSVLGNI